MSKFAILIFFFIINRNVLNMDKKYMRRIRSPPHSYKKLIKNNAKLFHYTRRPNHTDQSKRKYNSIFLNPIKTPFIAFQILLFCTLRTNQAEQHWEECLLKQLYKRLRKRNKSALDSIVSLSCPPMQSTSMRYKRFGKGSCF